MGCNTAQCGVVCGVLTIVLAIILGIVLPVMGEIVIPGAVQSRVHEGLAHVTTESVTSDDFNELTKGERTVIFFNLTNALALQQTTPTPKPIFEAVEVKFTRSSQYFDGAVDDNGESYSYKQWSNYEPVTPADMEQVIVNVNPVYLGALSILGPDEVSIFGGLAGVVLGMVYEAIGGVADALVGPVFDAAYGAGFWESTSEAGDGSTRDGVIAQQMGSGGITLASDLCDPDVADGTVAPGSGQAGYCGKSVAPFSAGQLCTPPELNAYLTSDNGPLENDVTMFATQLLALDPSMAAYITWETSMQFTMDATQTSDFFVAMTGSTDDVPNSAALAGVVQMAIEASTVYVTAQQTHFGVYTATYDGAIAAGLPEAAAVAAAVAGADDYMVAQGIDIAVAAATLLALQNMMIGLLTNPNTGGIGMGTLSMTLHSPDESVASDIPMLLCDTAADPAVGFNPAAADPIDNTCMFQALAFVDYLMVHLPQRLFVGCLLVGSPIIPGTEATTPPVGVAYDPLVEGKLTLNPDGTGTLNGGLFRRSTISEAWNGYYDRLFTVVQPELLALMGVEGTPWLYEGFAGHQHDSVDALKSDYGYPAEATETSHPGYAEALEAYTYKQNSGKVDLSKNNVWVEYEGHSELNPKTAETNDSPEVPADDDYPGWDTNGIKGGQFVIAGHGDMLAHAPATSWPTGFDQGGDTADGKVMHGFCTTKEWASCSPEFYFSRLKRNFVLECENVGQEGGCEWEQVREKVNVKPFSYAPGAGGLTKDGVSDDTCAGSVSQNFAEMSYGVLGDATKMAMTSTCDYMMRYPWVFDSSFINKAPSCSTLLYLGETDASIQSSVIFQTVDGEPTVYNKADDAPRLWIEPLTGRTVQGLEQLQNNFYVEKDQLTGMYWAGIFGADTDNNDKFIMPAVALSYQHGIDEEGANDFDTLIYGAQRLSYILDVVGLVFLVILLLSGIACVVVCKKKAGGKTAPTVDV